MYILSDNLFYPGNLSSLLPLPLLLLFLLLLVPLPPCITLLLPFSLFPSFLLPFPLLLFLSPSLSPSLFHTGPTAIFLPQAADAAIDALTSDEDADQGFQSG